MMTPGDLQAALYAACPGISSRCGSLSDKSTWSVDYPAGATEEQRAAVQAVIDAAPATLAERRRYISKRTIRLRLRAAGLEVAADAALASDAQAAVDWDDAIDIAEDDAKVLALLSAIGATPETILA